MRDDLPILVSACLLGEACRWDGTDRRDERVLRSIAGRAAVPICPEAAAGLGIPRPACVIAGGDGAAVLAGRARVLSDSGDDLTPAFLRGAEVAAEAAARFGARQALLKEGSPSCGRGGVTAARLAALGLAVLHEDDLK
jgi:uncharacterized protein YbbK (DUF523 family)